MKRIKDFVYNQNDLVIALLIIVVGATLIYGRMHTILDYPAQVAAMSYEAAEQAGAQQTADPVTPPESDPTGEDPGQQSGEEPGSETTPVTPPEEQTPPEVVTPVTPPEETVIPVTPDPPQNTDGSITFTIGNGQFKGWSALAEALQQAGVIDDAQAFMKVVWARNSAGTLGSFYNRTYTFERGLSYEQVIEELNRKK